MYSVYPRQLLSVVFLNMQASKSLVWALNITKLHGSSPSSSKEQQFQQNTQEHPPALVQLIFSLWQVISLHMYNYSEQPGIVKSPWQEEETDGSRENIMLWVTDLGHKEQESPITLWTRSIVLKGFKHWKPQPEKKDTHKIRLIRQLNFVTMFFPLEHPNVSLAWFVSLW